MADGGQRAGYLPPMTLPDPTVPSAGRAATDKAIRFALGAPGQARSLEWRVWVKDDEVHCDGRTAVEEINFIGYPTGRWRIEIGGAVSRWHRPKPSRPGWTRGPDWVISGRPAEVEPTAARPKAGDPLRWLPPPADGLVCRVQLWFAAPGAEVGPWRSALPPGAETLAVLSLRRSGAVHLVRIDETPESEAGSEGGRLVERGVAVRADQSGRPSFWETVS